MLRNTEEVSDQNSIGKGEPEGFHFWRCAPDDYFAFMKSPQLFAELVDRMGPDRMFPVCDLNEPTH
jgi:hypothetical protein